MYILILSNSNKSSIALILRANPNPCSFDSLKHESYYLQKKKKGAKDWLKGLNDSDIEGTCTYHRSGNFQLEKFSSQKFSHCLIFTAVYIIV